MSNLIGKAKKVIMTLGLFGIMLSLAGAIAGTATASASGPGSALGATTVSEVSDASALKSGPDGKIGVFAINGLNGSRVAGAEAVVIDQSGRGIAKGLTGADGYFATLVPPGIYKVTIIARGFFQAGHVAEVKSNEATVFKIGITPVGPPNLKTD